MNKRFLLVILLVAALATIPLLLAGRFGNQQDVPVDRQEVVFWHFWGGPDKKVVESVVDKFNRSQAQHFVRAVAMPGNNLQAKLFLSVTGGDPPDLVNQDDPILPDWAGRGVIQAMDQIADPIEIDAVRDWMLVPAQRLSTYDDRMFAVCNGLDVRALYYNKTALDAKGFQPPTTISELDEIATAFSPPLVASSFARKPEGDERLAQSSGRQTYGYLPDSRRLWAWGFVYGGDFLSTGGQVELNTPAIRAALNWMASYPQRYGADEIAAFRQGDQSLPGKTFPLLPVLDDEIFGRYVLIMDGQWRVREIGEFQRRRTTTGLIVPEFGVCPLPVPVGGDAFTPRKNAGWVNGNFFVVPQGAKNPSGAWEFMKFWIGYTDPEAAAETCAQGGWIPVSSAVIDTNEFQDYLNHSPLFRSFVELAASENQFPTPPVPGAAMFRRTVEDAAYEAMTYPQKSVEQILSEAESRIQQHLERARQSLPAEFGDHLGNVGSIK